MDGRISGAVTEIAAVLPVERAHTFLSARIHAVDDVGPGMCIHDFQMAPCPRHLQCSANCDEYIWLKHDAPRSDELKRQAVESLRVQIRRYEALEQQWLQRWQRIAYHCSRKGMSIEELDRPLDDLNRKGI